MMSLSWMDDAACRDMPSDDWFPSHTGPNNANRAIAVCRTCPAITQCGEYADATNQVGVWGGTVRGLKHYYRPRKKVTA